MKKVSLSLLLVFNILFLTAQPTVLHQATGIEKVAARERAAFNHLQSASGHRALSSNNFDVHYYRCRWEVDPAVRYIRGAVSCHFKVTTAANTITLDLHSTLIVDSVYFRNNKISFQHAGNALQLQFPAVVNAQSKDSVTIFYQGVPPDNGFGSFVTYEINGSPVLWTLSEPYGAKDWWPCKNGLDDKADSIDIEITNPSIYTSSSNGLVAGESIASGKKTTYWKHRYPIASYLVAIAVADYHVAHDSIQIPGKMLPVKMYSYPADKDYFKTATDITKSCLPVFSQLFGTYPFANESYSNTQFAWGGGMEHQTNSYITTNGTHLVSHELGHQWFGDKVTCATWKDIWLNEGFATYTQYIYIEHFEPWQKIPHLSYCRDLITSEPGGSLKVDDTANIYRVFDNRVTYTKGSAVVHMIRWRLGDSVFFKAVQQYLDDPLLRYGMATTKDLERNLEAASGQDFTEFFKDWYEGEGHPSYRVKWSVNKNNWLRINVSQTTSHPSVSYFEMPVPILFRNGTRDTLIVVNNTRNNEDFWVDPGFVPDVAIFDPEVWLLSANNTVEKVAADTDDQNQLKIFPNPVVDKAYISFKNPTAKKMQVKIFNAAGQKMKEIQVNHSGQDELIEIPMAQFAKGLYWIRIECDNGIRMVKKVVK
jgi:aminopeptidase N